MNGSNRHKTRREAKQAVKEQTPKKVSLGGGAIRKRTNVGSIKNDDGTFTGVATTRIKRKTPKLKKVKHKIKTNYGSTRSKDGKPIAYRN